MRGVARNEKNAKPDPTIINSEVALRRAALRARDRVQRSSGYVVVYRNGKIVKDEGEIQECLTALL